MPFKESGSTSNLYYSFEVAGAHIIMLGSYTDYDKNSNQYNWLKGDLAKVHRKKTPWLLVLFHELWYNSNTAHRGEGDKMMEWKLWSRYLMLPVLIYCLLGMFMLMSTQYGIELPRVNYINST